MQHVVGVLYVYLPGWLVCRLLMYIGSAVPPANFLALPFEFAASPFHISKGDKSNLNVEQLSCMQVLNYLTFNDNSMLQKYVSEKILTVMAE